MLKVKLETLKKNCKHKFKNQDFTPIPFQQKIDELERKLKEQEHDSDSTLLHQKEIKDQHLKAIIIMAIVHKLDQQENAMFIWNYVSCFFPND
ncbi:hypothetical protein L2E82_37965 [Cichorium intybus]|uniref:Uncharacterized protein n=1 Tax=Cichorium intybus TaxID=13427 RepID=A0ACB9AF98_CICIN|nr:hypothetical protein L2E82_37965 [Cichorium intybus]